MGVAPSPESIVLMLKTEDDAVTGRGEPYLVYLGPSRATAREVIDEAKTDDRDADRASKQAQAALWMVETLTAEGPMPTKKFEDRAKADGVYGSRNTFDRARKTSGVQSTKRRKQTWVFLRGQQVPDDDDNSPSVSIGGDDDLDAS
jgi:hypothetical protein